MEIVHVPATDPASSKVTGVGVGPMATGVGVGLGVPSGVGVGVGPGVPLGVGVGVGVGDGVGVGVGVGPGVPEGVGDGDGVGPKIVKARVQLSPTAAAGLGAVGATGSRRRWYNKIADITDTMAKTIVAITITTGLTFSPLNSGSLTPLFGLMTVIFASSFMVRWGRQ